jgi:hypothetical protein
MIFLKITTYVLAIIILFIFAVHAIVATLDPMMYGKYLQIMDNSRYDSPVYDQ